MTFLRCVILLQFAASLALGQIPQQGVPSEAREQAQAPAAVVRKLYRNVVAHHFLGIPQDKDRERLAPYLSETLIHRLDVAKACQEDYFRQYRDPSLKPQFEWLELGLFSGAWERAQPGGFRIDGTEPRNDSSFLVHLSLTYTYPVPLHWWQIAVVVVKEKKRFVIDEVIFPKEVMDTETSLSQILTHGCDGSKWVGYGTREDDSH
jgi:hypothetical protein